MSSTHPEAPFVPEAFTAAEGRMVVYQIADGEYRPATIVKCWGDPDSPTVAVNLLVFLDGSNDVRHIGRAPGGGTLLTLWVTSRLHGPAVGQWLPRRPR